MCKLAVQPKRRGRGGSLLPWKPAQVCGATLSAYLKVSWTTAEEDGEAKIEKLETFRRSDGIFWPGVAGGSAESRLAVCFPAFRLLPRSPSITTCAHINLNQQMCFPLFHFQGPILLPSHHASEVDDALGVCFFSLSAEVAI